MRNVKVMVNADTTQAVGKVRELTGALSQLDAVTKRNVQYLLTALSGAGLNPGSIGSVANQQASVAQAQAQGNKGAAAGSGNTSGDVKKSKDKNDDTIKKLNDGMKSMAEKQIDMFSDSFAKAISQAFTNLSTGKFSTVLTGLKNSLQGLFGELLSQLVSAIAAQLKNALSKQVKSIFKVKPDVTVPAGSGGSGGSGGSTVSLPVQAGSNQNGEQAGGGASQQGSAVGTGSTSASTTRPRLVNSPAAAQTGSPEGSPVKANQIVMNTLGTATRPRKVGTTTPPVGADAAKAATKFSWGDLGNMIGSMAPALGSSLGGMLGGSSTVGSIMGSLGGMAGGTAIGLLTGAIGPGLGAGAGGISFLGASMSVGLASGILAGVAVAALIGAWLLGKSKQRKADEKTRNTAMVDALSQLDEILSQVNRDEIDGGSAVTQANNLRKQYMDQMSQLKDKKTRNIALKDVSRLDTKIAMIKQAADSQSARKAMDAKLVPTFADGGLVGSGAGYKVLGSDGGQMQPFRGRVPGVYDRRDDFLARLTGNEVVLTPDVWLPIAPYLKQKRVPGFAEGGFTGSGNTLSSGVNGSNQYQSNQQITIEELVIHLNNQFGGETAAKVIDVALKTPEGAQAVVRSVRTHVGENGLGDGLVRDINKVNDRGF